MKNLFIGLVTVLASAQVQATSLMPAYVSEELGHFRFQPESHLDAQDITSGRVVVSPNGINLVLQPSFRCDQGLVCAMVMPETIFFNVGLDSTGTGGCGETIYTGVVDRTPVDGNRVEIEVVDNRTNRCMHLVALPEIEVTLKIDYLRLNSEEVHKMTSVWF